MSLDKAEVRRWIDGMREAEIRIREIDIERLRASTPAENATEFFNLRQFANSQASKLDDPELWHRRAALEYGRVAVILEKLARASTPR